MKPAFAVFSASRPTIFLLVLGYAMAVTGTGALRSLAVYAVAAAFFLASSCVLVTWIPAPKVWRQTLLLLEIAAVAGLDGYAGMARQMGSGVIWVLYIPVMITVPMVLPRRWWWPAILAVLALFVANQFLTADTRSPLDLAANISINGAALLFSGAFGALVRSLTLERERIQSLLSELTDSQAALERAHRQLQASAASSQAAAVLEERQRLTREIHDGVAHGLTALIVQIQAGRKLLDRDPGLAAATIERCESLAREALVETRRAVRALHNTGLAHATEADALERLGRDFGMATGIAVQVEADEAARHLPPDPDRLEQLYRIFQEALTNAHRHGQARAVTASLRVEAGQLRLTITNDGAAPVSMAPGLGLQSMAERARLLGGSVRFEPGAASGLSIHVCIPVGGEMA